jgi:hypothetical protein
LKLFCSRSLCSGFVVSRFVVHGVVDDVVCCVVVDAVVDVTSAGIKPILGLLAGVRESKVS